MRAGRSLGISLALVAASLVFLAAELVTHVEFFFHLAAIPLEVLLAVFIVERLLERREAQNKRRLLMYIKSTLFRSEMRNLFLTNFAALKAPAVTMAKIKAAALDDLRSLREKAEHLEYKSLEAMEPVILEYVRAREVWVNFMNLAISFNFEEVFQDMIYILHFVSDVETFKASNPRKLFIREARAKPVLMAKVRKVLGDGIQRFLDYAIELKEKQPAVFEDMMSDYVMSGRIRGL